MQQLTTRFYQSVPKTLTGNLRFRATTLRRASRDKKFQKALWQACSCDPLFWVNTFVWTYDPRARPFPKVPFITYPEFQDDGLLELVRAVGSHDLFVEKSRDMGASWLCLLAIDWHWRFRPMLSFLLGSRVEDYVDKSDNPKSLFWKLDFLNRNLPSWLMPRGFDHNTHRQRMHYQNPENGSVIDGESTTGNFARGDRRTAILLDEFAAVEQGHRILSATRDATRCRLFNSTPAGTGNAYYDVRQTNIRKLRFHWSDHPDKNRGLYTTDTDGSLKVLDPAGYPQGYRPTLDGKVRSPWYDEECERAASPQEIAQELDIDYLGSGWQFFNADRVQQAIRASASDPVAVGDLGYDSITAVPKPFREDPNGRLKLWFLQSTSGGPPGERRYVIACDVSAGTGASNSTACVWDIDTAEKVAQYANPFIRPEEFARQTVALARWFHGAMLVWEQNGPGRQFGGRVRDVGYTHVYWYLGSGTSKAAAPVAAGWPSTRERKTELLGDYRDAVEAGQCINRSRDALHECLEYVFDNSAGVIHARAVGRLDPSGARDNHGDLVIADAIAWHIIKAKTQSPKQQDERIIPYGSLAWRRKQQEVAAMPSSRELDKGWQ